MLKMRKTSLGEMSIGCSSWAGCRAAWLKEHLGKCLGAGWLGLTHNTSPACRRILNFPQAKAVSCLARPAFHLCLVHLVGGLNVVGFSVHFLGNVPAASPQQTARSHHAQVSPGHPQRLIYFLTAPSLPGAAHLARLPLLLGSNITGMPHPHPWRWGTHRATLSPPRS